jgi:hypothetical protein
MSYIVLTAEQARVIREASDPVEARDDESQVLERIPSSEEAAILAEAKKRLAPGRPRYPMADVRARLQKLEALSQREHLDSARVKELLLRMRAGVDHSGNGCPCVSGASQITIIPAT